MEDSTDSYSKDVDYENRSDTNATAVDNVFIEITLSEYLWKIVPPIILVIGVVGNMLNLAVVRRLGISRQPTLVFISFLAVADTVVLLVGLPRYWLLYLFDFDLRTISSIGCKFSLFFIYLSMQFSSWILVSVCLERLIKTHFPFRYRVWYSVRKTVVALTTTLVALCIVDMHFFWTNGVNDFTEGSCDSLTPKDLEFDEKTFVYIDFAFLSAVPFTFMFVCNVFITRALRRIQFNRVSMMHDSVLKRTERVSVKMTKMLLVTTAYFLVATAPICIYFILDSYLTPRFESQGDESSQAKMKLAWTVSYLFQFSNYGVNFFLYTSVNDRFKSELKLLLRCKPRRNARLSVYAITRSRRKARSTAMDETTTTEVDKDDTKIGIPGGTDVTDETDGEETLHSLTEAQMDVSIV